MLFLPIILLSFTNYVAATTVVQTAAAPTVTDSSGFNSATCQDFDGVNSCLGAGSTSVNSCTAPASALQCACAGVTQLMNCWSTYCPEGTSAADMIFLSGQSTDFCVPTAAGGNGNANSITATGKSSAGATGVAVATTASKGVAEGGFGNAVPVMGGVLAGVVGLIGFLL